MGSSRSAVRGAPPEAAVPTSDVRPAVRPPTRRRAAARVPAQGRAARRHAVRSDATGPLSLVPRRRRTRGARLVRAVAFPAVVAAVLALGGWETHRIVLAQQPTTTVIAAPAVSTSWGRVVVLSSTTWVQPDGGRLVDVAVRLVGSGTFDPASVTLRTGAGAGVPASAGATRPVRLRDGRPVEGRLGFAVDDVGALPTLVVREADGTERLLGLRPGVLTATGPSALPATWTTAS